MTNLLPKETTACMEGLGELENLLRALTPQSYTRSIQAVGGSIGGHTRHILDHFFNVMKSCNGEPVFFEDRRRGTSVEYDPRAALQAISEIRAWLENCCGEKALGEGRGTKVSLSGNLDEFTEFETTLRRELIYCFLHAVHHMALVAVIGRLQNIEVPADFGKAPATRVYEASLRG